MASTGTIAVTTPLIVAVLLPVIAGSIVGQATQNDLQVWYKTLTKPSWQPPNWAFGPLWTLFYLANGLASYLVWAHGGGFAAQSGPLKLYAAQLALNLAWPIIFFKWKKIGTALLDNLLLLGTAAATARSFYQVLPEAGWLMVPYVAWLAFATLLNFSVWRSNPHATRLTENLYEQHPNPGEGGDRFATQASNNTRTSTIRDRKPLVVSGAAASMPASRPQRVSRHTLPAVRFVRPATGVVRATAPRPLTAMAPRASLQARAVLV